MKILVLAAAMGLSVVFSFGQVNETDFRESFQFGLKVGANYANVYSETGDNFKPESNIGFAAGVVAMIPITKYFGIQPEVLYSEKGFKATGNLLGAPYKIKRKTGYLDVPLYLVLKPSESFSDDRPSVFLSIAS